MAQIDQYLTDMLDKGGSDLHLTIDQPPKIRMSGDIVVLNKTIVSAEIMEKLLHGICLESRWIKFLKDHDLDFAYEIPNRARFRCNFFFNHFGMGAVFSADSFENSDS